VEAYKAAKAEAEQKAAKPAVKRRPRAKKS
jgi:hypothetical protein